MIKVPLSFVTFIFTIKGFNFQIKKQFYFLIKKMLFNFILIFLSFISIANGTFKRKLEAIVEEEDLVEEEPLFKKINNSEKDKLTKRALVISTNFDSNNFKMNAIFANLLTKHFYVHYLIINTKEDDFKFENENFSILDDYSIEINKDKNTFEIFNLPKTLKKDFSNYEFLKYYLGAGNIQEEQIKRQIERESLEIFQKIFCFGRNINRLKNFNLGLFDSNNIGALFVFHAAGIKNVFCVNNTPLKAYQFKYAGKEFPENIPGIDDHKKNEELYETLHEKMVINIIKLINFII
uniref:Uncharacterized protein n=1 Tax=Meloidogyne enterolobii TaxID=390850 RepID=A0A6V7X5D8_MELEN|nr:unnamed protein product [Meloidogyne enterolobii]